MTGPGGREVGRISVRVLPDTSSFGASLEKYLQRTERVLRLEIPVSLQAGDAARTEAELAALTKDRTVNVKTNVDRSSLSAVDKIAGAFSSAGQGGLSSPTLAIAAILAALPALLALPSALAAVAAPIAVVAAGISGIKEAAGGFLVALKVVGAATSAVFADLLPAAFKNLGRLIPTLLGGFQTIAHAISVVIFSVVDAITSPQGLAAISDTFTNIGTFIFGLAPSLGKITTLFLQLMDQGSKAMVNFLPDLVMIIGQFTSLANLLIGSGLLAKAFSTFNFFMGAALFTIGAFVIAGVAAYAGLNLIATGFINVIAAVARFVIVIGSLPGKVGGALSSLAGVVAAAFQAAWNAAVRVTKTSISAVVSLAGTIGSKVSSAVGNLGSVLFHAGQSLIQGLIDGIGSMFGAVKGKLGDLTGKLTSWKGPKSLDKVILRESGQLVIGGFVNGLTDGFSDVKKTLGGLTADLPKIAATSGSTFLGDGTSGPALGAGVTQNIYPQPGQSEAEIARISANRLLWAMN